MNKDLFRWYEEAHNVLLELQKENPKSEGLKTAIKGLELDINKMKNEIPTWLHEREA